MCGKLIEVLPPSGVVVDNKFRSEANDALDRSIAKLMERLSASGVVVDEKSRSERKDFLAARVARLVERIFDRPDDPVDHWLVVTDDTEKAEAERLLKATVALPEKMPAGPLVSGSVVVKVEVVTRARALSELEAQERRRQQRPRRR